LCVFKTPTIKTLESLWLFHGLNNHSSDEQVAFLTDWVEILYGEKIAD
jgi:hypothetical protein